MYGWRGRIGHVKPSILDNISEWNQILPQGVVMVITVLGVQDHTPDEFHKGLSRVEQGALALAREEAGAIIVGGSPVLEYKGKEGDEALIERLNEITHVPCATTRSGPSRRWGGWVQRKLRWQPPGRRDQ